MNLNDFYLLELIKHKYFFFEIVHCIKNNLKTDFKNKNNLG